MAGPLRMGGGGQIGARPGVPADVAAGSVLLESPAQPRTECFRQVAMLKRLTRRVRRGRSASRPPKSPSVPVRR